MIIQSIELENFRSYYGRQSVDTTPSGKGNIIAIGGLNGAGKTTLQDAIAFAMVGHSDYFKMLEDMERRGEDKVRIARTLDGLLNRRAKEEGTREARVKLSIQDDDGSVIIIDRAWVYDSRGVFKQETLRVSHNGEEIDTAGGGITGAVNPYEDFLRNKIPSQVVRFFVFDGEKIQDLARDDPEKSLEKGINDLLGFHLLETVITDMDTLHKQYRESAQKRNRQEEELGNLRAEETKLANECDELDHEISALVDKVDEQKVKSRDLAGQLTDLLGGASGTSPKELQRESDKLTDDIGKTRRQIEDAVDRLIIPTLPGKIIQTLLQQLDAESKRAQWEEGKRKVEPNLDRLAQRLFGPDAPQPSPPLLPPQVQFFDELLRGEWGELFNPPPEGIAKSVRHDYLSPDERSQVKGRCAHALRVGAVDLGRLLERLDALERKRRDSEMTRERLGDGKHAEELLAAKTKVDRELGEARGLWEERTRSLSSRRNELKDKRKELTKKEAELDRSGHSEDRMVFVRKVRRAVQTYQERLKPRKREEVARHLSEMYRMLARKEDVVQRIELDGETYRPRVLDRRGELISLHSQSAGEREIYALSLLWALAKTSGRDLPVVIDTPLARLDSEHRANIVKRYLPAAGKQVIVLSTDTELDRRYFEMVEGNVAKTIRLEFDPVTERTTIKDGYFEF